MITYHWDIGTYILGKHWKKYFITRNRLNPGTFATKEWLTKEGKWTETSRDLFYFTTEKEAKEFATKHCGPQFTKG